MVYTPEAIAFDVLRLMHEIACACPHAQFVLIGAAESAHAMVIAAAHTTVESSKSTQRSSDTPAIAAVILLSAAVYHRSRPPSKWLRRFSSLLLRPPWRAWVWSHVYASCYGHQRPDEFLGELQVLRKYLQGHPSHLSHLRAYLQAQEYSAVEAMVRLAKRRDIPVVAIYGRQDVVLGNADVQAEWLRQLMPLAQCVILAQSGHFPHVDAAHVVVEVIARVIPSFHEDLFDQATDPSMSIVQPFNGE